MNDHGLDAITGTWIGTPDAIDLAAEREANALAFLAEIGQVDTRTMFEKRRDVPERRNCRYALAASLRAHQQIHRHYTKRLRCLPSSYHFDTEICTKRDRKRREERQGRRKELLAAIEKNPAQWVPFTLGCQLADLRPRTLHRRIMEGVVARTVIDKRVCVSVEGLRTSLRLRLKVAK